MSNGTAKDVASIVAAAGEIVGRTRLQKTAAVLEMAGVGFGFPFSYYKFGPFSDELVDSADRAVALGYVREEEHRAAWGGRYSIFRSTEVKLSGNPARDALINLSRDADSIVLELAVTAAFLAREGYDDPWGEVAERKPEKITRARISSAKSLYRKFLLVPVPQPLPAIA